MESAVRQFTSLWERASGIWVSGGWCMVPIAITALLMFGVGIHVFLRLRVRAFLSVPESTWRRWIDRPDERTGPIGDMLHVISGSTSLESIAGSFQELRASEVAPFRRDLRLMRVCIAAAPLLGLLGTVTGMLTTFDALASGSGGEQTMGLVAKGIAEALITTETGLVVALPGVFFQYRLARRCEKYQAFLAHLETVCTQHLYRELVKVG